MSYGNGGLIGLGQAKMNSSMAGLKTAADLEERREQANDQLKQADKTMKKQAIGAGAGLGLMTAMGSTAMGAQYGAWAGPMGMAMGAAAGYLAYELF